MSRAYASMATNAVTRTGYGIDQRTEPTGMP
jgi:hypothetical protein